MITSFQMRAARALLGIDQRRLAELAGVSVPTIQRMEASGGNVRGVVDSLTKVVDALNRAGVELIGEHARSDDGGRGVRLREPASPSARRAVTAGVHERMLRMTPKAAAACLIGWPAAHSRSPLIHHYWLRTLGIEGGYSIEAVPPEGFAEFVLQSRRITAIAAPTSPSRTRSARCR